MDPRSLKVMEQTSKFAAHNYDPLPVVITSGRGVWGTDDFTKEHYLDCIGCYSALNFGYSHPFFISTVERQIGRVCVLPRTIHNDIVSQFYEEVTKFCGMDKVLPMVTGAEGVETAIKISRRWGHKVKGVKENEANIIVCENNFHGRTTTIIGFSSVCEYRDGFGPFTPGFRVVSFGSIKSFEQTIDAGTVAVIIEPIQGEGGVNIPPDGYLKAVEEICREQNILLVVDEVQTGFGRTGYNLAFQHDEIKPDMIVLGKALGGGILPTSAVVANDNVMDVITPGSHGSTFGGYPLSCAIAISAIRLLKTDKLSQKSRELGEYFLGKLQDLQKSGFAIKVRGRGLMVGIEMETETEARLLQAALLDRHILVGKSRNVIRINPPLIINQGALDMLANSIYEIRDQKVTRA